jgi:cytochrome c-type biogenesis protein
MTPHPSPDDKHAPVLAVSPNQVEATPRRGSKWLLPGLLFGGTLLLVVGFNWFQHGYNSLAYLVALVENPYQQWLENQNTSSPFVLIPLAFAGGLIASISPCILSLLPVNLSYIGTLNIASRRDAALKASLFVLGAITVFSLFGLFSSFAGAVLVDFRGYINIAVGAVILVMGACLAGLIHLPLPQIPVSLPIAGPYGVGLTFALVSSPCASPVLFAVLAAAAGTGSQIISTVTMVSYALGYTAVIFFASLFAGLVKQSRVLLSQSEWVMRLGSAVLILAGGYYLVTGIQWFL